MKKDSIRKTKIKENTKVKKEKEILAKTFRISNKTLTEQTFTTEIDICPLYKDIVFALKHSRNGRKYSWFLEINLNIARNIVTHCNLAMQGKGKALSPSLSINSALKMKHKCPSEQQQM